MEILKLDAGRGVLAFSTLRGCKGSGMEFDPYAGFSVCHYTGGEAGAVAECRRELAEYVGVDVDKLVIPRQTHSVNVAFVGDEIPDPEGVDALVTCRDDVALVVNTADCLPVVLSDGRNGVAGVAHCGWRGLYDGIIAETIRVMESHGAVAGDIHAAIGPGICADCYEVDDDFAGKFDARYGESGCVVRKYGEKPHVNLQAVAKYQLKSCGIADENIFLSPECSKCGTDLFSARKLGVKSGRIATVVKILK